MTLLEIIRDPVSFYLDLLCLVIVGYGIARVWKDLRKKSA